MPRPLLDGFELQQVQRLVVDGDRVLVEHGVPALEGDFLQQLGRRASRIDLIGVLSGPESSQSLKALREKFRQAEPVDFVADISAATQVGQVLIERMNTRELSGKPQRFEYAFRLREFLPPSAVPSEAPPVQPPPLPPPADEGTLIVEVIVEGQPAFDFSRVRVTVSGTKSDMTSHSEQLSDRTENRWSKQNFPAGSYIAEALAEGSETMSGSVAAQVSPGQTTQVTITLRPGAVVAKAFVIHFRFDSAFVEPCMRPVLRQVAEHAEAHPEEKLVIIGHTDLTGSDDYNQALSERRSRSAFAFLTFGRERNAARDEWNRLRKRRTAGQTTAIEDSWGTREYQFILQDLGYYDGAIDGIKRDITEAAVRAFQSDRELSVDGDVGDQTWPVLIEAFLSQDSLAIEANQFMPNSSPGCDGGIVPWLGCGEKDPVRNTRDAWRPNRRTEFLFARADSIPCQVPEPATWRHPSAPAPWCLGPGDPNDRCCFLTRTQAGSGKWLVRPADSGTVSVTGTIRAEDGAPMANQEYILIAPDGEFMDGEKSRAPDRGEGFSARTAADGSFTYDQSKGVGVFTLEVKGSFLVRLAGAPPQAARGNIVCRFLDGSSGFDVIAVPRPQDPTESGPFAVGEDDYDEGSFVIEPIEGVSSRRFTVTLKGLIRYPAVRPGRHKPVSAAQSTYPLVVIAHGHHPHARNDGTPIESYRGLEYLARHLASHGYIAASIDQNDLNQHNLDEVHRALTILRHIDIMESKDQSDPRLGGKIDLENVALVGHSRGGLAVLAAQQINVDEQRGRNLRAVFSIAPTDRSGFQAPSIPTLIILGSADRDVTSSPAQLYDQLSAPKAMIYIHGAIHNFFNTHPDWVRPRGTDFGERDIARQDGRVLSPGIHLDLARGYALAFFELFVRGQNAFKPHFNRYKQIEGVAGIEVHHQFQERNALLVDDFEQDPKFVPRFGRTDGPISTLGLPIEFENLANYEEWVQFTHFGHVGFVEWDRDPLGAGRLRMLLVDADTDPKDVSSFEVLSFRTALEFESGVDLPISLADSLNPPHRSQKFSVALRDAAGRLAQLSTDVITRIPYPYLHHQDLSRNEFSSESESVLKTIRIPLGHFKARSPNLDLSRIDQVAFVFQDEPSGDISIDSIEFSL